jgi:hypothetical protein
VIGVGVKQSTSDLLIANCDEFIFYDDLVRERAAQRAQRGSARKDSKDGSSRRSPEEEKVSREEMEERKPRPLKWLPRPSRTWLPCAAMPQRSGPRC